MPGRLLFVFLDGVGLGAPDPEVNPFAAAKTPVLEALLSGALLNITPEWQRDKGVFRHVDASLGISGLPQSATGQTALLTGKNGAEVMRRHYGPWPGPTLKAVLDEGTLFSELRHSDRPTLFANIYPAGYFAALKAGKRRVNVPVYAALAAGLPLLNEDDYRLERGVSADLTGAYLHQLDATLPQLRPAEMGARLAAQAQHYTLTFFDFWLSDSAGHRWSWAKACALVEQIDTFLGGVVSALDETTLLVTSDHGNLEDKGVRTHTAAPVPLLALGPAAEAFAGVQSLLDIAPAVRRVLELHPQEKRNQP